MKDNEKRKQRFLRDPLEKRLGGLAATMARISSSARNSESPVIVENLLDEAKHYIEWTAADAEIETAAELVQMQRLITLWQKSWKNAFQDSTQRVVLSTLAKEWSDRTLQSSGLV
ncbi:MAG: hypothetical protein FJZ87_01755 [Chloroflexi bacterium]|nr:hypothetical protein [Chloroflexota bacterium]